jgi:hypothetical protein
VNSITVVALRSNDKVTTFSTEAVFGYAKLLIIDDKKQEREFPLHCPLSRPQANSFNTEWVLLGGHLVLGYECLSVDYKASA